MEILTPLLGNIGTVTLLILIWKSGLLKYILEMKNGNGRDHKLQDYINGEQKEFNEKMEKHASVANEEVGKINERFGKMEISIAKIELKVDSIDKKLS